MTHTQHAAAAICAQLPPDVARGGALDGLIAEIVAELVRWLKSKCYPSADAAYAYLTREYWLDPWGWRESRRQAAITGAINQVVQRTAGDALAGYRVAVATAARTALAANLTLPMLRGLYEECP